ncbi:NAD(P)/FAD-dependent oxidoreductase [soil metagenome]
MRQPSRDVYDVVIAGGGPAGSSLAIRLASAGLSVLVAEQKRFPREKLCGEFISPECLSHFEELGVLPGIMSQSSRFGETVFYARRGRSVSVDSEWFGDGDSNAVGLSRAEMDDLMLRRAGELGVDVCEETTAVGVLTKGETIAGVRLKVRKGDEEDVAATLVVDATGRNRSVAREAESSEKTATRARHVAFKTHVRDAAVEPGACEIYSYRGGYGGCNAIEGGLFNVCFIVAAGDAKLLGSDPDRVLREVVSTNQRARETMMNAEAVKPWLAVPIQRFGRGTLNPRAGLVTVGDSAAFIDPFTGSGILLALQSSKILSYAITRNWENGVGRITDEYQRLYSAAFDSRLRWCSMLRTAAFSPLAAELTIAGLGLSRNLRRRIARLTRFNTGDI